ncbi:hypothetical protein [Dyadobacter tibetensis]|uniref:hypothetical protein n=1 Tax=Dyadobacter tibetensis TaxID=1211851 RepID=UPI00046EBB64|nr:hypothetical protein [Dyadobacter tibetensis]
MPTRNTFVFGIGGTGARVIRSLTMLLAAGTRLTDTNKIIPIIIDVDADNADTSRALKSLQAYKFIRDRAYSDSSSHGAGFFNSNLNTLSSIAPETDNIEGIEDSFQLQFENLEKPFLEYLDPNQELVHDINMDLLEALYDNSPHNDPNTELNLRLNQGFKGNPNIGSVVFNNLANTKEFRFVLRSIGEGDRIFIVSSIFGGTGSSGFPQLIKLLQQEDRLKDTKFGALTVMPYFNVTDDQNSAINSDLFNSKTEAALTYYRQYLKGRVQSFYQLWDRPLKQYENKQGGVEQKNSAHLIEMIGASAIIDFVNKADGSFPRFGDTHYYDFGIKKEDQVIDIRHFFPATAKTIMEPLTLFTYAMKIYLETIPELKNEAFFKELNLSDRYINSAFYQNLTSFFSTHYKNWLLEMADNERKFQPFNVNDPDLNSLVRGKPIEVKKFIGMVLNGGISETFLKTELGKIEDELKKSIQDNDKRFLELLNRISLECFKKLEALPSMS